MKLGKDIVVDNAKKVRESYSSSILGRPEELPIGNRGMFDFFLHFQLDFFLLS